jgi:hypothetical protein
MKVLLDPENFDYEAVNEKKNIRTDGVPSIDNSSLPETKTKGISSAKFL